MQTIVPKNVEGQVWCEVKHLAGVINMWIELGNRINKTQPDMAKDFYKRAGRLKILLGILNGYENDSGGVTSA